MLTWCGPAWNFNIRAHPAFLEHPCQPFPHPWASIPSISAPGWLFLGFLEFSLERGSGRGTGMGWEQGEVQHAQIHIPREKQPRGAGIPPPPPEFSRSFQPSGGAADPVWGLCASLHPNSLWEFTGIRAARGWEEIPLFPVLGDPGLHNSLPRLCLPSSTPKNPPGSRSDPGETPVWDRASPDGEYWEYSPSQTSKIPKFAFNPSLSPSVGLSLFLPSFGIEFPHPHLFLLSLLSSHF